MLKTKTKVTIGFVSILSIAAGVQASNLVAQQVEAADSANTTFQVNVVESLSVTVEASAAEGTGNIDTFLRNTVDLDVTSNNTTGFTATMYADTSASDKTSLTNSSSSDYTIPSLTSTYTRGNFPDNYWGYSLDATTTLNSKTYNETNTGNANSNYHQLPTSTAPATVLTGSGATSASRSIYLGTKADASKAAGTYTGTVVIGVVTGTVNENNSSSNPVTPPSNPATNSDTSANTATYNSTNNRTVYYTTSTDGTTGETSTTAEVTAGDTRNTYYEPQGVTEHTKANIASGTPLATGLAVTAAVAATSGFIFFILAKRKKDDDEEEEQ